MDQYVAVACSHCSQPIYIPQYKLEMPTWKCPACGGANTSTEARQPVFTPVERTQSRFGRTAQAS